MSYADRISTFNQSIADAKQHADNIAGQIENLKAINRDPTKALFNKINDSVGTTSGTIGQAAQLYHTYKHGKVLTFLEKHEVNQALGKGGNGGLKNAGNELLNTVDQARNAPIGGVSPNSQSLQLPKANELVSSLKGRLIGNETDAANPNDLAQLVGRTQALPAKADAMGQEVLNKAFNGQAPAQELAAPSRAIDRGQGATHQSVGGQEPADYPSPITAADRAATKGGDLISGETQAALEPLKLDLPQTGTSILSRGSKLVNNLIGGGSKVEGEVSNAGKIAGKIGDSIGNTLGKMSGEGGGQALGDTIATSMEAAAPETGALAPLVAAVGGLVALGSSIAGMFHKNKPPPPVKAVAPVAAAQVGADLSVVK